MNITPIPEKYLSDHLFLLVGANPLPNLVVARLLAKVNGTVWLLHSDGADGEPSTKGFAENLEILLLSKRGDLRVRLESVSSSDNMKIENRVREIIGQPGGFKGDIGLNYTGGTKPMSVHTYRELEKAFAQSGRKVTFSYLDPRKLALRIDGKGTMGSETINLLTDTGMIEAVKITIDEISALHGYERTNPKEGPWATIENTEGLSELCIAIIEAHASSSGFKQWRDWIYKSELKVLPDTTTYPELNRVRQAMEDLCGGSGTATPNRLAACLMPETSNPELLSCRPWFLGTFLEEYCQICFQPLLKSQQITWSGRNLHYRAKKELSDHFELDAIAMMGYQLFAVSCITSDKKDKTKEHFFEVYVRARQLGGDEARIGLVCCYERPDHLEIEIAREWDANQGRVRVFGRRHLKNLAQHFSDWVKTANK